jgi:hypothetical protein
MQYDIFELSRFINDSDWLDDQFTTTGFAALLLSIIVGRLLDDLDLNGGLSGGFGFSGSSSHVAMVNIVKFV